MISLTPLLFSRLHRAVKCGALLAGGALISSCSTPKSEVVVSVKDQRMGLYSEGVLTRQYAISTSKFGIGDRPNSYCTPLGKHEIIAKIGHGLPPGAVLKSRSWNGEVLKPNAPGRDPIVSRILWLRGLESSNRNAMKRFIYIHGTPEETRLGQPASYGCIRMGMQDVVDAFENLNIGAKVVITRDSLPGGRKAEKPEQVEPVTPAPEPVLVAAAPAAPAQAETAKKGWPQSALALFSRKVETPAAQAPAPAETAPAQAQTAAPQPVVKNKVRKASKTDKVSFSPTRSSRAHS